MAESVKVTVGFTQNIGNFENIKTEVSWDGTLLDDEDHAAATDRLFSGLEEKFVEKAREVYSTMTEDAQRKTQIKPKRG